MKQLLFVVALIVSAQCAMAQAQHCDPAKEKNPLVKPNEKGGYGAVITPDGAMEAKYLETKMQGKDEYPAKVKGRVTAVCKVKGCWMEMATENEKTFRVRFKDYGFFVPMELVGKDVAIQGTAYHDTTTVAMLRHYAEDAGKSKAEIEKITEPEITLLFMADGVIPVEAKQ